MVFRLKEEAAKPVLKAICKARFLQVEGESFVVHDWEDYTGGVLSKRRQDRKRKAANIPSESDGIARIPEESDGVARNRGDSSAKTKENKTKEKKSSPPNPQGGSDPTSQSPSDEEAERAGLQDEIFEKLGMPHGESDSLIRRFGLHVCSKQLDYIDQRRVADKKAAFITACAENWEPPGQIKGNQKGSQSSLGSPKNGRPTERIDIGEGWYAVRLKENHVVVGYIEADSEDVISEEEFLERTKA